MLSDEIIKGVDDIMRIKHEIRRPDDIPDRTNVTFGDKACIINAYVLYCDMRNSTGLLNKYSPEDIAKILKPFHLISSKIVKFHIGELRSINGDSLLAFFNTENALCDNAVEAAFAIKYYVGLLLGKKYGCELDYGIGIDRGRIFIAKVGSPGEFNNDLIWIGEAVNQAAKFGNKAKGPNNIYITKVIFKLLSPKNKYSQNSPKEVPILFGIRQDLWKPALGPPFLIPDIMYYYSSHQRPIKS